MKHAVAPAVDEARRLFITVEESPDKLERHLVAWDVLAANAAEPNPFYESHALLPAWRLLAPASLKVVCIWAPHVLPGQPPHLAALIPIVRRDRYRGAPVTAFATWRHDYSYLTTPLVHAGLASLALETFFDWLRDSGAALMEWDGITSDGAFRHALIDTINRLGTTPFQVSLHTRAYFQPRATAEHYLENAINGKKRKELRRQERRLGELGKLQYDELAADGDLDAWLTEFLELEALGWKGKDGTALRDRPSTLALFRAYARGAHGRKRWTMFALRIDGRPIAMKCNLLAGNGAVAFKIAYDESFARFSPGVLLEVEHVRRLHEPGAPAWMDSGAAANHPMIGHLWRDKIAIETLLVPTGKLRGELVIAALPLVRWTSRMIKSSWHRLRKKS